jgi:anti-anti-sigma regulatory factor
MVAAAASLVLSFERCTYCDSFGLALLVSLRRDFGSRFAVVAPRGTMIRKMFDVVSIGEAVRVCATVDEAVDAVSA